MASLKYGIIVLLLVNVVFSTGALQSAGDQYKGLKGSNNLMQTINDVTVKPLQSFRTPHRFYIPSNEMLKEKQHAEVPELQVGCGEGFTDFKQDAPKNIESLKKIFLRQKRSMTRKRRDYYDWPRPVVHISPLQSVRAWQPAVYQISRPYFIPVWGAPGRIPIYFPPQPLLANPGYPVDNPRAGSLPPKRYLPPDPRRPTEAPEGNSMDLDNRFNFDDDDDRPIWDLDEPQNSAVTQRPLSTTTPAVPTRKRRPSGKTTTPPSLVHSVNNKNSTNKGVMSLSTAEQEISFDLSPPKSIPQAPSRPPGGKESGASQQNGPSRCVWAIISCCSTSSGEISYSCFEQLGCPGAFWDTSPCDSDFARSAIDSALNFYDNQ